MPQSDGCTGWLDGVPAWAGGTGREWLHCCVAHDGGGSDYALAQCVADAGFGAMSVLMLIGLLTFGALCRGRVVLRRRQHGSNH